MAISDDDDRSMMICAWGCAPHLRKEYSLFVAQWWDCHPDKLASDASLPSRLSWRPVDTPFLLYSWRVLMSKSRSRQCQPTTKMSSSPPPHPALALNGQIITTISISYHNHHHHRNSILLLIAALVLKTQSWVPRRRP